MPWIRIDDHAPEHPKLLKAGESAAWLWVCGLAYCSRHLTDGEIPEAAVCTMGLRRPLKAASMLVMAGLWTQTPTGYHVHDYHAYQPSKAQVTTRRQRTAERLAAWRRTHGYACDDGVCNGVTNIISRAVSTHPPDPDPDPVPVPQEPISVPRAISQTPVSTGPHRSHAACGRVCVPAGLHLELVRKLGTPDADERLRAWYREVDDAWQPEHHPEPIVESDFDFWRARWREKYPPVPTSASAPLKIRQQAEIVRREAYGGRCPHGDPACATYAECVNEIAAYLMGQTQTESMVAQPAETEGRR